MRSTSALPYEARRVTARAVTSTTAVTFDATAFVRWLGVTNTRKSGHNRSGIRRFDEIVADAAMSRFAYNDILLHFVDV
jgi:hypothetical protein